MSGIINAHVHMIEIRKLLDVGVNAVPPGGIGVYEHLADSIAMLSPKTLIGQMDEAGIDTSVLFAVDAPIVFASNEYVKSLIDRFPDRLIGFASVSPHKANAVEQLDRAISDLGLVGVKLHPPLQGFFPDDEAVFPIYEKAVELDVPIVFHVGTTPFGDRCRLAMADPLRIDDVANAFPRLRIMLTHLGTLWHHEAFMVVEKHPNVFIDTAAYVYEIPELLTLNLVKRLGKHKFIFGTDYPSPFADEPHRMKDFVDVIRELPLSKSILDGIFKNNFQQLLKGHTEDAEPFDPLLLLAKLEALDADV